MGIFNCAKTLPEAIDSILAQTYKNWELIMCDDCSTDDTYDVAKEYQNKYPHKIILIRNTENKRLAFSLNHCLKYATGHYVARMDGDDISASERFEKQINYLKKHPNIDLVGTAMQRFNEKGLHDIVYAVKSPNRYTLRNAVPFNHATIMTYKYVYDRLNGYTVSDATARAEDYELWFRFFAAEFCGDSIAEPLYYVREDINAIKRRTPKSRWDALKIARNGFKLLKYPRWWLIRTTCLTIFKSITPVWVVNIYRWFQRKFNKQ